MEKPITITLNRIDNSRPSEITAYPVTDHFAVHREASPDRAAGRIKKGWVITHIPSGMRMGDPRILTMREAKRRAHNMVESVERLCGFFDWSGTSYDAIKAANAPRLGEDGFRDALRVARDVCYGY